MTNTLEEKTFGRLQIVNIIVNNISIVLLCYSPLTKQAPFPLPEMSFLEQGDSTSWPSPAMTNSTEISLGEQGTKVSRWTSQEAVEEEELPGLKGGEATASSGEMGLGQWEVPETGAGLALDPSITQMHDILWPQFPHMREGSCSADPGAQHDQLRTEPPSAVTLLALIRKVGTSASRLPTL